MASEIVGITFFFITMIVLIVYYFKTRHIERMSLISNGKTAKIFDSNDTDSNRSLKLGLLLLSIGLGLCLGLFFDKIFDTKPAGVFVSIFILGGMSLIFYHFYIENRRRDAINDDDHMV